MPPPGEIKPGNSEMNPVSLSEIDRIGPTRRPEGRVVMRQTWENLLFLHWEADAATIQAMLPPELTVDTFEGRAYIGLVPFTMRNVRPVWVPPMPLLSHFPEVNVRTYVHHRGENPGVWFFSLDAENPVAVKIARTLWKLPYFTAQFNVKKQGAATHYVSRRRDASGAGCDIRYAPDGPENPAMPGSREFFLAERYLLYAHNGRRLFRGQVHHKPYRIQSAQAEIRENTLVTAAGIRLMERGANEPPLIHYARGVDVEVFPLRAV